MTDSTEGEIMIRTLECAIYYIEQGWQVLPLYTIGKNGKCTCGKKSCSSPGKHPYHPFAPNGVKDATVDRELVARWFDGTVRLNIGIAAGEESGLVLLDIDPGHGGDESIKKYRVPETLTIKTGGGGLHYYFKHPAGIKVRNSAGKLGPGIDVRGHHGYVVAAPSMHVSGNEYAFVIDPRAIGPAPCPEWIIDQGAAASGPLPEGEPILEGQRDNALISIAGKMRHAGLNETEIYATIAAVNQERCKPPVEPTVLRRIAKSAASYEKAANTKKKASSGPDMGIILTPALTVLSDVTSTEVQWLWPNRFPLGKISLLVGDPGVGKSYLTLCLAAIISNGWSWPIEQTPSPKGTVIILTCEDDISDTIKPRLEHLGADCSKIVVMEGVKVNNEGEEWVTSFEIVKHMATLEQTMVKYPDTKMIIFDPITAYLGAKIDSHRNSDVRSALNPLTLFAHKYKVAILGINHLSKKSDLDAIYRTLGSIGFVGAPRAVWGVAWDKHDDRGSRRLMTPIKANLSVSPDTIAFSIVDGVVMFEAEAMQMTGNEAFGSDQGDRTDRISAREFLQDMLGEQDKKSTILVKEAHGSGISKRTLDRAKDELGVKSYRLGDCWYWSLNRE